MKVALACPYAWDAPGGVQVHVGQLARRLADRGHEVLVLAPSFAPIDDPLVLRTGRPVRVRFNRSVAPIAPWPGAAREVREALEAFAPDLVHAHEPFVPGAAMFAARASRAPVVATFHAYADRAALFTAVSPLLRRVWERLDGRIAVSQAASDFVSQRFPDRPIRIVPNGVEVEPFANARPAELPPGRRILFVNRLDPRKGFRTMVRAFGSLIETHPDALLVVAGDGPERSALERLPAAAKDRTVMLGNVPHGDLPPFHAASEVFCAPAVGRESFGIVLVEAMAAGLPVVASDIPGYRDVVRDGVEGILTPSRDAAAVTAALRGLLDDPELGKRLGAAGRERAARFSWDVVTGEVEAVYREVIHGP